MNKNRTYPNPSPRRGPDPALLVTALFCLLALASLAAQPVLAQPVSAQSVSAQKLPSIAGRWYSYYGFMDIEQTGLDFTGTYSCCRGQLEGKIGGQISFTWQDEIYGEGWGYFRLESNGRLSGSWGGKDDMGGVGQWGAVRAEVPEYDKTPQEWRIVDDHSRFGPIQNGVAFLVVNGTLVEGHLTGSYTTEFQQKPYHVDVFLYLDGRVEGDSFVLEWEDPRYGHFGEIKLERDGKALKGEWEPFGAYGTQAPITFVRAGEPAGGRPAAEEGNGKRP